MDSTDPLVASMRSAVQAAPSDIPLRRHLAVLLAQNALHDEAILHAAAALHAAPRDEDCRALMRRLLDESSADPDVVAESGLPGRREASLGAHGGFAGGLSVAVPLPVRPPMSAPASRRPVDRAYGAQPRPTPSAPGPDTSDGAGAGPGTQGEPQLDPAVAIVQAQEQAQEHALAAAMRASRESATRAVEEARTEAARPAEHADDPPIDERRPGGSPTQPSTPATFAEEEDHGGPLEFVPDTRWSAIAAMGPASGGQSERHRLSGNEEQVHVTLADVAGMDSAKERIEAAVLAPVRHPELLRLYRQSLTGGALLYGPAGCGKTFLARAVAGELNARFVDVRVRDIVEPAGDTDSSGVGAIFEAARAQAPAVLLLQDIEVLSRRRGCNAHAEQAVTRITAELDAGDLAAYGVYVLATTSAPWDIDDDLRRPGRLGRPLLVLPPDQGAREFMLRQELDRYAGAGEHADLPLAEVSLRTEGYSCTDLERLCTLAASNAARDGRAISEDDLRTSVPRIAPSTEAWMSEAARIAGQQLDDPFYRELREYLRARQG